MNWKKKVLHPETFDEKEVHLLNNVPSEIFDILLGKSYPTNNREKKIFINCTKSLPQSEEEKALKKFYVQARNFEFRDKKNKFLESVRNAAEQGDFDTLIPEELKANINGTDYNNALLEGARNYFEAIIEEGDLINYDSLTSTIPNNLVDLHKKIKLTFVERQFRDKINKFLESVRNAAKHGTFDTSIPEELKAHINGSDYNNTLLEGARNYFEAIIEEGDLINYDSLTSTIPSNLVDLHKEIKKEFLYKVLESVDVPLDSEQLDSVLAQDNVIKVTARAGSGKTRVLVAKALYLINFYNVSPNEILLIAFNKNAAHEIQNRLKSILNLESFHTARTFHSLAYQISKPKLSPIKSDSNPAIDQMGEIIEEILTNQWDLKMAYSIYTFFRNEAIEYEGLGLNLKGQEYYEYRRLLAQVTLRGEKVKSLGEKYIADYFFEHDIKYKYEPSFNWGKNVYHPDFGVWVGNNWFIWEHWAFNPDVAAPNKIDNWDKAEINDYKNTVREKRKYWADMGRVLIETHAGMLNKGRDNFEKEVRDILNNQGIKHHKLSVPNLLKNVKRQQHSKLSRLLAKFITLALSTGNEIKTISEKINQYKALDEREAFFLKLGANTFKKYISYLKKRNLIDFALLFPNAIKILNERQEFPLIHSSAGRMIDLNKLKYIFIDEAQDMSGNYLKLIESMKVLLPNSKFMFVGDDWQAINRFSGADVKLFIELNNNFSDLNKYVLKNNYRSRKDIVKAGNLLMGGDTTNHAQASKSENAKIQQINIDSVWIEMREGEDHQAQWKLDRKFRWGNSISDCRKNDSGNEKAKLVKIIYDICKTRDEEDRKIAVLFRRNKYNGSEILSIRDKVIQCFKDDGIKRNQIDILKNNLEFSTAHRSKGKEYDTVVIVQPHVGSFPMFSTDAELFRFFGDSVQQQFEDEKRLFYVAITRAKRRLIFAQKKSKEKDSPFMQKIKGITEYEI